MKTAVITRTYFDDATLGIFKFLDRNNPCFYTIERPWLDNKTNESCIPEGEYICEPYSSDKYPDVWELQDVKDRSLILIHVGNWAHDVKGCIAIGLSSGYLRYSNGNVLKAVQSSSNAVNELRRIIGKENSFKLIIKG